MPYALIKRSLFCAISLTMLSSAAMAGGYGGSSANCSPVASQDAQAMLAYADRYQDGNFRVRHMEAAGAEAHTGANGESGSGFAYSSTQIEAPAGATSWKRSVQRSGSKAKNGSASGNGFSASFVKVRTNDGKYYMFKGMADTSAKAGPGGTSTSRYGVAKSRGGRY